ncbi:hypothetical protein ACPWME_21435, partial [Pandoraea pneumonica]|uniref:hypothetical protein n=1 Tax=Pandoraea pneumonica TaxID=2508299 RepID=UPI003CF92955
RTSMGRQFCVRGIGAIQVSTVASVPCVVVVRHVRQGRRAAELAAIARVARVVVIMEAVNVVLAGCAVLRPVCCGRRSI